MKNIPYLLQAIIAAVVVSMLSVLDDRLLGVDFLTSSMNIAFALTAYLFVGHAFWKQTVADMRANFDDPENQRMLTQLSAHSGSMYIPMLTVILFWWVFAALAALLAFIEDTSKGPLTYP